MSRSKMLIYTRPAGRPSADIKTSERLIHIDFDSWSLGFKCLVLDMALQILRLEMVCHPCPPSGPCRSIESQQDEHQLVVELHRQGRSRPGVWQSVAPRFGKSCNGNGIIVYPIGSMCGIFTYIWLIFIVNVGKYTVHGSYGYYTYYWCLRLVRR